jgi:hypothetical protein
MRDYSSKNQKRKLASFVGEIVEERRIVLEGMLPSRTIVRREYVNKIKTEYVNKAAFLTPH